MECARPAPALFRDCRAKARCRLPPDPALNRDSLRRKAPAPESPARAAGRSWADRPPCRSPLCGDPPTAAAPPATPSQFRKSHLDECVASPGLAPLASNCGCPLLATSLVARVGYHKPKPRRLSIPYALFAVFSHRRFKQTQLRHILTRRMAAAQTDCDRSIEVGERAQNGLIQHFRRSAR